MKILVVDDEKCIRNSLRRVLTSMGHEVSLAEDGICALELLKSEINKENFYKLIITDFKMNYMHGDELAQEIKNLKIDIPIILISGNSWDPEILKNFDYYLPKPYEHVKLKEILDQIVCKNIIN